MTPVAPEPSPGIASSGPPAPSACSVSESTPYGSVGRFKHDRPRAITKKNGSAPVGIVRKAGERFRADHEHATVHTCADELRRRAEGVHKAGTGGAEIERGNAGMPSWCCTMQAVLGKK